MRTIGYTNYKKRGMEHIGYISLKIIADHGNKIHHSTIKKAH